MSPALLDPPEARHPCGIDLRDGFALFHLRELVRGKPETQFSKAQDPDWAQVRAACEQTFEESKDLEVLVYYLVCLLQTEGWPGLTRGCEMLLETTQSHWPDLYPSLDASDHFDPVARLNALATLTTPPGLFEEPIRFLDRLRQRPLAGKKLSLSQIETLLSESGNQTAGAEAEILRELETCPAAELQATRDCLENVIQAITKLDQFLDEQCGENYGLSWDPLLETLRAQHGFLTKYSTAPVTSKVSGITPKSAQVAASESAPVAALAQVEESSKILHPSETSVLPPISTWPSPAQTARISNRVEVIRAIDEICAYYALIEPSSPVPVLLERAKQLVDKTFSQLLADLLPGARCQIDLANSAAENSPGETT